MVAAAAAVVALAATALLALTASAGGEPAAGAAAPQPLARAVGPGDSGSAAGAAAPSALPAARAAQRRQLLEQVALTDTTLCTYAASTRYPPASRPIAEHPDQVYPNAPVTETQAMRTGRGQSDAAVQLQTSQSRVFLAAGEAVALSLRAVDTQGQPLPLVVTRAAAQGMTYNGQRATAQIALAFADDGAGADGQAGDGAFGAVLAPAQTGLASFHGTIRSEVRYSVNGKQGVVLFDVIYTPELPATWAGPAREVLEDGSLVFYLKANVLKPGRYVVQGRVDDAKGRPLALASFNDVLPAGPADIKLLVFGKLLRDAQAALPLVLRDVDGYLLRENADPDRLLMPRLEGRVAQGKVHPLPGLSDAEWHSEERQRHLDEFGRDAARATAALAQFDPAVPVPKSACAAQGK